MVQYDARYPSTKKIALVKPIGGKTDSGPEPLVYLRCCDSPRSGPEPLCSFHFRLKSSELAATESKTQWLIEEQRPRYIENHHPQGMRSVL